MKKRLLLAALVAGLALFGCEAGAPVAPESPATTAIESSLDKGGLKGKFGGKYETPDPKTAEPDTTREGKDASTNSRYAIGM